jgi:transposase
MVVNPCHARDLAKATGRVATTESLEARGRAHVPEAVRPIPRVLLTRWHPLVQRRSAERRRLPTASQWSRADIPAPMTGVERRLARTEVELSAAMRSTPLGRATDERLQSTPGVGPRCSRTLVAGVPEWGAWHRQEIAVLIGIVPLNRDSSTLRGKRAGWGGRAPQSRPQGML